MFGQKPTRQGRPTNIGESGDARGEPGLTLENQVNQARVPMQPGAFTLVTLGMAWTMDCGPWTCSHLSSTRTHPYIHSIWIISEW